MREIPDRLNGIIGSRVDHGVGPSGECHFTAFRRQVDGDYPGTHGGGELGSRKADRSLPEDCDGFVPFEIDPFERAIGGSRPAGDGRA